MKKIIARSLLVLIYSSILIESYIAHGWHGPVVLIGAAFLILTLVWSLINA